MLWEHEAESSSLSNPTMVGITYLNVAVAQLVEHSDVARAVVGSSPIGHPKEVYASG